MTMLQIDGEIDDLFSHMTLLGLAAILEDAGVPGVRLWWDEDERAVLSGGGLTALSAAELIHTHASERSSAESWLHDRFTFSNGKKSTTVSTVAPRTASPEQPEDWQRLEAAREASLDKMTALLDHRLLAGLGYRSWWYYRGKEQRADVGANIWEMRTRNRGTEFVADRLLPIANVVASWSVDDVWRGILGEKIDDTHGKNSLDSRTPTGLSLPRPVDNARAWCALWALSLLPVAHLVDPSAAYPAYVPRRGVREDELHQLIMPVPNKPTSLSRMRAMLRSSQLITAVADREESSLLKRQAAWEWMQQQGAAAILRFPVRYVGSTSAPERQALSGVRVWP